MNMRQIMDMERAIRERAASVPEFADWPDMARILNEDSDTPHPGWHLPVLACRTVGGDEDAALPGAAAIACLEISIVLVDDMLDDDPRGEYLRIGCGAVANLGLAFQAAAFRVMHEAVAGAEQRSALIAELARVALTTALAQHWDVQNLCDEQHYWKVVRAKTVPLYSSALHIGAVLGGAAGEAADGLLAFGAQFAEMSQVRDDLLDAFETPANPDWTRGRSTLPILYARTADHADRERFAALLPNIDEPQALENAQKILIDSGALSYCVYQILQRYREARDLLARLPLTDPTPMADLLAWQTQSVTQLVRRTGVDLPLDALTERQE